VCVLVCVCDIKVKLVVEVNGLTGLGCDESLRKVICSSLLNTSLSQLVKSPPCPTSPPPKKSADKKITNLCARYGVAQSGE